MFRLPKHKRFDFQPRYYDERKEDLDKRVRQSERERDRSPEENFRETLRAEWSNDNRRKVVAKSNKRLMYIGGILAIAAWYYFFN